MSNNDQVVATIHPLHAPGRDWTPVAGLELEGLLKRQFPISPNDSIASIRQSTLDILSKCVNPNGPSRCNTGLIVGYVQSGKTLSFTAVTAAAHDNGFKIVIVLGGTINILLKQTKDRLEEDLETGEDPGRPWVSMQNPGLGDRENLIHALSSWSDDKGDRETALIAVLKNANQTAGGRLNLLADVLDTIPNALKGAALIIDDEADQVSLNTKIKKGEESPNFSAINRIRDTLPLHTYLQYTATPQAPIFIPLMNQLSPDFAHVLNPGEGYVGGSDFFLNPTLKLVDEINDVDAAKTRAEDGPPDSLQTALRLFMLGVAQGHVDREHNEGRKYLPENRTMMIHPSRLVQDASNVLVQVQELIKQWTAILESDSGPDRTECVEDFKTAHDELVLTVGENLASLDLLLEWIPKALKQTRIEIVNSLGQINDWKSAFKTRYSWILVGGQKLDRGFTVSGLTVTWMPRGAGVYNADTIQQRARFFGYKKSYLPFCRVYLDGEVLKAFSVYVPSEESMRDFLKVNSDPGLLKVPDLERKFLLDPLLNPCRQSVIVDNPFFSKTGMKWVNQNRPHADISKATKNRDKLDQFLQERTGGMLMDSKSDWLLDPDQATDAHIHKVWSGIRGVEFYELLANMEIASIEDFRDWRTQMALLSLEIEEDPEFDSAIVYMRPGEKSVRSLKKKKKNESEPSIAIKNLAQGAYPSTGKKQGSVYKGDREVKPGRATLQVYTIDIKNDPKDGGEVLIEGVTALRLFVERDKTESYIVQHQAVTQ